MVCGPGAAVTVAFIVTWPLPPAWSTVATSWPSKIRRTCRMVCERDVLMVKLSTAEPDVGFDAARLRAAGLDVVGAAALEGATIDRTAVGAVGDSLPLHPATRTAARRTLI